MDASKARQLFDDMPEASRSESLTQYLLYKVALLDKDTQLGRPISTVCLRQHNLICCGQQWSVLRHFPNRAQDPKNIFWHALRRHDILRINIKKLSLYGFCWITLIRNRWMEFICQHFSGDYVQRLPVFRSILITMDPADATLDILSAFSSQK